MKKAFGILPSLELGLGLLVIFTGRQVLGEGEIATIVTWVGVAMVMGAVAWRVLERQRAPGAAQPVETWILWSYLGVVASLVVYGLSTDWGLMTLGVDTEEPGGLAGILVVSWPAMLVVSLLGLLFMEAAYLQMPVPEAVEARRVQGAAFAGVSIGLALVFVVSLNYVAVEKDVRKDLSYFQTTRPSEATLRRVENLSEPIRVVLFYPPVNDVLTELRPYFDDVDAASDEVDVEVHDHALDPETTRRHRVRDNGFVVLIKGEGEGEQAESFEIGTDLESARNRLRTLDGRFQESFMRLTTRRRELHVTAGHDERSRDGIDGDTARDKTRELDAALERSNITTRQLGMAQGLANRVPEGAPAVAVIGPRSPLLPEEARSLLRYVQDGGRLVVMVDPDVDHGLGPLLRGLGVELASGVLASDRNYIRRDFGPSDRTIVRTSTFSSHPTVTVASRNASRLAAVFIRGGSLERYEGEDQVDGVNVVFPMRGDFWLDTNGNFERDEGEAQGQQNMIAAVTIEGEGDEEGGRAVVIADGDFVTDQVIRNPGNALVFGDVMQWLLGEEQLVTETATEEDQLIEHTTEEDKLWFWGTSFGVPLPILAVGVFVTVRRRSRRTTERGGGSDAPTPKRGRAAVDEASAKKKDEDEDEEDEPGDDEPGDDEPSDDEPSDEALDDEDEDEASDEEPEASDEESDEESDDSPDGEPEDSDESSDEEKAK